MRYVFDTEILLNDHCSSLILKSVITISYVLKTLIECGGGVWKKPFLYFLSFSAFGEPAESCILFLHASESLRTIVLQIQGTMISTINKQNGTFILTNVLNS